MSPNVGEVAGRPIFVGLPPRVSEQQLCVVRTSRSWTATVLRH